MFAVGFVHRPHGLAGEVSVERLGDFPDSFEPGAALVWMAGDQVRDLTLSAGRQHGARLLLSFEGITDVEAARKLGGGVLCVEREKLPARPPDFFWSHEIEGWACEDPAGRRLGAVGFLEETPAGPLLTLETSEGKEVLVPFVRPIVVTIDPDARRIVLDLPEGLMDL